MDGSVENRRFAPLCQFSELPSPHWRPAPVALVTTKAPRKQYQLWRREKGSLKQYKRAINGVNSVRLFAAMQGITLEELTLAGAPGFIPVALIIDRCEPSYADRLR